MRGTGSVVVDGTRLYGYFTTDDGRSRLRLSCDEWDSLGLCEGQRVAVALPGHDPRDLLVVAASRTPPFVWLDLAAAVGRAAG
jgi:hypothetical protein